MEILYIKLISKKLILTPSLAAVQCSTVLCWHVGRFWCYAFQFGVFGGKKNTKKKPPEHSCSPQLGLCDNPVILAADK